MEQKVLDTGVKAGLSIVESSLLGAFAVLCLTVAVFCVVLTFRTQNARVADQKALSEKLEALIEKQADFNTKTTSAIEKLNDSERQQVTLLTELKLQMQNISLGLMTRGRNS
jgi:cell division protein FtsL